ncbi:hypothetical protein TrRE_jg10207, partial [Triparma retinervis]
MDGEGGEDEEEEEEEDPGELHVQCVDLACAVINGVHKHARTRGDKERLCGSGFLEVLGEVLVGVAVIVKEGEEEGMENKVLKRKVMEGNTLSMSPTGGGGAGGRGGNSFWGNNISGGNNVSGGNNFADNNNNKHPSPSISHLSSTLISTLYSGNPLYSTSCISLIHLLLPHLPSIPLTLLTILPLHLNNVEQWVVPVSSIMRTQGVVARLEAKKVLIKYYHLTESVSIPLGLAGTLHSLMGTGDIAASCLLSCLGGVCGKGTKWLRAGVVEECVNVMVNQVWQDEVYRECAEVLGVAARAGGRGRERVEEYVKKGTYLKDLVEGKRGEF